MTLLVDEKKVQAAAQSFHQFYPLVRALFPKPVDDTVVEAITVFLYVQAAKGVFGRRFVLRMDSLIPEQLKYATPEAAGSMIEHIGAVLAEFKSAPDPLMEERRPGSAYEHHVRSLIKAMLFVAEIPTEDSDLVCKLFVPLENAFEHLTKHLEEIRTQNHFLL